MSIEDAARDAAIASAGSKTALTSGGALLGWGVLNSEWVFGVIGVFIGLAGLAIQFYFQKRKRDDEQRKAEADNRRAEEIHNLKIQIYNKQINGVASAGASLIVGTPPCRSKQTDLPTTDFGGLADE